MDGTATQPRRGFRLRRLLQHELHRQGKTPQDAAKEWAAEYVKGLVPGDGVAVLQARQQVLEIVAQPSRDLKGYVPKSILDMPRPGGGCDLPAAVRGGRRPPGQEPRGERDVIVLTDGQRFGWSDADTMRHWEQPGRPARQRRASRGRRPLAAAPRLRSSTSIRTASPTRPTGRSTPIRVNVPFVPVGARSPSAPPSMVRGNQKDATSRPATSAWKWTGKRSCR